MNPAAELPLFVFGTLRRGESNHHCLAGHYDRWLPATLCDFKRTTAAHGYPQVVPSPGDHVTGELFFIRAADFDETLRRCDILEDLPIGHLVGPYYQRARVVVETAEGDFIAWAYIDPGPST
ncbi:MAG: gamma-glutamylcyclotransferase [Deltaproteobacteria bacterium]